MVFKPLNGVKQQIMPSYTFTTPTKIGIGHIGVASQHTFCMRIIKETFRNEIE